MARRLVIARVDGHEADPALRTESLERFEDLGPRVLRDALRQGPLANLRGGRVAVLRDGQDPGKQLERGKPDAVLERFDIRLLESIDPVAREAQI